MAYKKVYRKNFGNNNSEEGARTGGAGYGNSGGNTAMVTSGNEIIFDVSKIEIGIEAMKLALLMRLSQMLAGILDI